MGILDFIKGELIEIVEWTDAHGAAAAMFPTDRGDPFFNVNTPDDLDRATRMLETGA